MAFSTKFLHPFSSTIIIITHCFSGTGRSYERIISSWEISTEASESNFWRKGHTCYPQMSFNESDTPPKAPPPPPPSPAPVSSTTFTVALRFSSSSKALSPNFFNPTRSHRFDFHQTWFDCTLFLWQLILPVDFLVVYYQLKRAKPLNRFEKWCRDSSVEIGNRKRTSVLKFRRHMLQYALYLSLSLPLSLSPMVWPNDNMSLPFSSLFFVVLYTLLYFWKWSYSDTPQTIWFSGKNPHLGAIPT